MTRVLAKDVISVLEVLVMSDEGDESNIVTMYDGVTKSVYDIHVDLYRERCNPHRTFKSNKNAHAPQRNLLPPADCAVCLTHRHSRKNLLPLPLPFSRLNQRHRGPTRLERRQAYQAPLIAREFHEPVVRAFVPGLPLEHRQVAVDLCV